MCVSEPSPVHEAAFSFLPANTSCCDVTGLLTFVLGCDDVLRLAEGVSSPRWVLPSMAV